MVVDGSLVGANRQGNQSSAHYYLIPLCVGQLLFLVPLFPLQQFSTPWGLIPLLLGLGLAIAARLVLAGNWTGPIGLRPHHKLITHGPYKWLRHPIYVGLSLAFIGTALISGHAPVYLGCGLIIGVLIWKIKLGEQMMFRAFPEYRDYKNNR